MGLERQRAAKGAGVQLAANRRAFGVLTLRQRQRERDHAGVLPAGATYRVVARSAQSGVRRLDLRARGRRLRIPVRLGPSNATQEQFTAEGEPTAATRVFTTAVKIRRLG